MTSRKALPSLQQVPGTARRLAGGFLRNARALGQEHPAFTAALLLTLLINFVLLGAYLWSRGGQTTKVRLEVDGDRFQAFVDGRLATEATFTDAPERGGIVVAIGGGREKVPSLPSPRGIDAVQVTDLDTGEVLFEDDFANGPKARWKTTADAFALEDGVLRAERRGVLSIFNSDWKDYRLEVTFKNLDAGQIGVRAAASNDGVFYSFRPFRHFDNQLSHLAPRQPGTTVMGRPLQLNEVETVKSIVAMAVHPYPFVLELLAVGMVAIGALQFLRLPRLQVGLPTPPADLPWLTIAAIVGSTFGVLLFLLRIYAADLPHVPDELSYLFQARLLASGRLAAPPPPVREVFDFFSPPFIALNGDKWASIYPFGHPAMLAIGELIRAVWLVPPLIGAATVGLVFLLGRRIHRTRVGLLASVLLVTSPFFLMTGSNYMSHNTAAFYLVASLVFLAYIDKRPALFGLLAGVCFGLLFNTRPLTSLALVAPFATYLVSLLAPRAYRPLGAQQVASFLAGGLLMLLAYWLYNWGTTGDPFSNGYQAGSNVEQGVGFGARHSFTISTQHEQTQLALLLLVLHGWPQYVGLAFVLLPFILGTRHRWDWFLLTCAVLMMAAYLLWRGSGVMHGPRYWYETTPLLMLLAARGVDRAADLLGAGAAWIHRIVLGSRVRWAWAAVAVTYGVVLALVGGSVYGWLLSRETAWSARFVPARSVELQGFNFIDDRLVRLVREADLHNALVLVEYCPHWWCYGNVFWMNSPDLDGEVVFARNIPRRYAELFRAYPDRRVYVATYTRPSLSPYALPGKPPDEAPLAREIAASLRTPTPTVPTVTRPAGRTPEERDAQRKQDLATIAAALHRYYRRHGSYPVAIGLQTLCRYPELDAACALEEELAAIPQDPSPGGLYWYQSDGERYSLFAQLEGAAPASACPKTPPRGLELTERLYCVRGGPPAAVTPTGP